MAWDEKRRHLLPTRKLLADYARGNYFLKVPPGVSLDDLMDPDFWQHLAAGLKVDARLEVVSEDGTIDADLRVIAIDPRGAWVQMRLLRVYVAQESKEVREAPLGTPDNEGYRVEWAGPSHRFRIIAPGGEIVEKNIPDKTTALEYLAVIKAEKVAA